MNRSTIVSFCAGVAVVIGLAAIACGGDSEGPVPASDEAPENADATEEPEADDAKSEEEGGDKSAEESGGEEDAKAATEPEADE